MSSDDQTTVSDVPVITLSDVPVSIYTPSPPPPPPGPITLADILAATEVLQQKEASDKALLETIGSQSFESLRTTLIQWGVAGFPNAYPILTVPVTPPTVCSDGVQRSLTDYIAFCSGKTIAEHVAVLQAKLDGMTVMYANFSGVLTIVISKA